MAEVLNKIQYDKKPEQGKSKELDPQVLKQMMMSPSSGSMEGNITTPDETAKREKDANESAKLIIAVNSKKVKERLGKYKEDLVKKAQQDPASFEVEVSKGEWMNLKEAIAKGWNPKTGQFDLEPITSRKEEILGGLPSNERDQLSRMIDPANLELSAAQGEELGLSPTSPMLQANGNTAPVPPEAAAPEANPQQPVDPAMAALLGGQVNG